MLGKVLKGTTLHRERCRHVNRAGVLIAALLAYGTLGSCRHDHAERAESTSERIAVARETARVIDRLGIFEWLGVSSTARYYNDRDRWIIVSLTFDYKGNALKVPGCAVWDLAIDQYSNVFSRFARACSCTSEEIIRVGRSRACRIDSLQHSAGLASSVDITRQALIIFRLQSGDELYWRYGDAPIGRLPPGHVAIRPGVYFVPKEASEHH